MASQAPKPARDVSVLETVHGTVLLSTYTLGILRGNKNG
jgi:hypothetical protein